MRHSCFAFASLAILIGALPGRTDSVLRNRPGLPLRAEPVEIRLTDGSSFFTAVLEDQLDITTPYGKLKIKLASVTKIEFGIRIPADLAKKLENAAALLEKADKRVEAWSTLTEAKEFAYPTLVRLSHHRDKAVAAKAAELIASLKKTVPVATLNRIGKDVIHTDTSKIAGQIEMTEFKVLTPHFGQLALKLSDLALLRQGNGGELDDLAANVLSDPGQLSAYQSKIGQTFYFRVTGSNDDVWGTDIYTTDSTLAAAAVHAGVLKMGQTGIVKVSIIAGQQFYTGSVRNGVSSGVYGFSAASFRVSRAAEKKEE